MQIFGFNDLDELTLQARNSPRLRQHRNIHQSFQDPCQRLFNAIELNSYIRPHRHATDPRNELLIAIRGKMALLAFDDAGTVTNVIPFGSEKYGSDLAAGAEIPANTWHTVIALEAGCILLEVKAGPFDPNRPKDLAPWSPEEGCSDALPYLEYLLGKAN